VTQPTSPEVAQPGDLITVEAYQAATQQDLVPLGPARLGLADAEGLVLAEDVTAAAALPPFDNSSMDGYAVLAADIAGASPDSPAVLRVAGEIAAGNTADYQLVPGTAIAIMTGARLPAAADAVVPVEWTDGGTDEVAVYRAVPPGSSVRYAGGDAAAGEALLAAGTRLRPMHIAVAASAGRIAVSVRPRPRVAVLSTGDELTEPGTPLAPGRIWDSNSYMIAAAARQAGAVAYRTVVRDDPAKILPVLEKHAARADILVTTGGVSMGGEHDVVKEALRDISTVHFYKVAMQPGMPQGFGLIGPGRVPLFALPGNPVSAYVSFQMFVRPALATLQNTSDLGLARQKATLTAPARSPAGRRSYLRAVLHGNEVTPLSGQQSHQVAALGRANALIIVPERDSQLPAGAVADVLILP
jgi:molybdopterin molybdotransferase